MAAAADGVTASGHVAANVRLGTTGCGWMTPGDCPFVDFRDAAVVGGDVHAVFADGRARADADADLRLHAGTVLVSLDDAGARSAVQPWSVRVRRAAVTAAGTNVRLTAGADVLRWSVADGVSPVDVLNPFDLEDPTRLDRRLAVPMVHGAWFKGRSEVAVAWTPFFVPALLPTAQVDLLAGAREVFTLGSADDVREIEGRVELPPGGLASSGLAVRVATGGGPVDAALSFTHARDALPQVDGTLRLIGFATDEGRVDVGLPLVYPRQDVLGLSVRGELPGDVGAWAECTLTFPERTEATLDAAQLDDLVTLGALEAVPDPLPVTVTQEGEPYARWVVGAERTFGRVYLNAQWLRGFPTERQAADLGDYALLAARVTLADRWILTTRAGMEGAAQGGLGALELSYLHADSVEVGVGAFVADGREGSALRGFRGASHVGTSARLTF
jgi:hypothetical protein